MLKKYQDVSSLLALVKIVAASQRKRHLCQDLLTMPDSLYGARLQGFTVVVFIVAKSRAWFDEYIYHDSLQARARGNRALKTPTRI